MNASENALFLTSNRIPVPHGFSTRRGGVSDGVHASLNLGWTVGDAPERVTVNFERLAGAAGFALERLHTVSQVHGDAIREVSGRAADAMRPDGEADALWSRDAGTLVGVKTADCVPLILVAPDVRAVAAIHSGWRGALASIAARAVEALASQGAAPSRMVAALGPSIRRCCYEVSEELGDRFRVRFGARTVEPRSGGSPHLDLVAAVLAALSEAGVAPGQVDVLEACTACDPGRFFSHRRDAAQNGGQKGLHLSFAECRFS